MYLSVQEMESLGRLIAPWTIIEFDEEGLSFGELLCCIKASRFSVIEVSDDIKRAKVLKTFVGNKLDTLMVSGSDQCVIAVCSQFGIRICEVFGQATQGKNDCTCFMSKRLFHHDCCSKASSDRR